MVVVSHALIPGLGGMIGVTLFFVLSGFLITHILLDEDKTNGHINLKAFYGRRALRLLPALLFYLAGIAVVIWAMDLAVPIWETTWPVLVYIANYVQIAGVDLFANRHTWSLAVEEHFYLVWPFLVVLGATKRVRPLVGALLLLIGWRLVVGYFNPTWAYMATDTNAFAVGLGCLLAVLRHNAVSFRLPSRTPLVSIVILLFLGFIPFDDIDVIYRLGVWIPILAAGLSGAAVWASIDTNPSFLRTRLLSWFGLISYALYLWHAPLLQLPGLGTTLPSRVLAIGVGILMAWISWRLIERPILRSRWRRRLDVRRLSVSDGTALVEPGQELAKTNADEPNTRTGPRGSTNV